MKYQVCLRFNAKRHGPFALPSLVHPLQQRGQRLLRVLYAETVGAPHVFRIARKPPDGNRPLGPDRKDASLLDALVDQALRHLVDLGALLEALHELRILPVPPLRRPGVAVPYGVLSRMRLNHDVPRVTHALEGGERNAVRAAAVQKLHPAKFHGGRDIRQRGRRAQAVDVVRQIQQPQVFGSPRLEV